MQPQGSEARARLTGKARETWIRRLIDLSRRNNLLYHRDLKNGTLDLTGADPDRLQALLSGKATPLADLLPYADPLKLAATAREIARRAQANLEEKGLETLFLAVGMASWPPRDEGRPPEAAILLVPMAMEIRGFGRSVTLRVAGEIQVNLVLLHVLETELGCKVDPEEIIAALPPDYDGADPVDLPGAYEVVRQAARQIPGFTITDRAILGNFSFQKMAMVRDLLDNGAALNSNEMIAAIAGDTAALEALRLAQRDVEPSLLDRETPDAEFFVLDADSSQHAVAAVVLQGQSVVIQGPPGTGKSQVISNLIASLAAAGRRVLFVAEKRAALEVVHRRLANAGLGHLALDLHGADLTRRTVMRHIAASLDLVRNTLPVNTDEVHRRFVDFRGRLVEHVRRMHEPRSPSGRSVYQMQGRLLRLPAEAHSAVRWRDQQLSPITGESAAAIEDLLTQLGSFASLFLRTDPSPWNGALLPDGQTALRAMDLVTRIELVFANLRERTGWLADALRFRPPATPAEMAETAALAAGVAETLDHYSPALFEQDLTALSQALAPAGRGFLVALFASLFSARYKSALRSARALRTDGAGAGARQVLAEVSAAADQQRRWRELSGAGSQPVAAPDARALHSEMQALQADLAALAPLLNRPTLAQMALGEFEHLVGALHQDTTTPHEIAAVMELEAQVERRGAGLILAVIRKSGLAPERWPDRFRYAYLASCLDKARLDEPELARFNGRTHDKYAEEFRLLDRTRVKLAADRVRRRHAEHAIAAMNAHPDQDALVRREAEKKTRHLPLRKLLAAAPDVLTALFPCFMASPLSVSQLMGADRRYFDVVLFDEASQVLPEDAVPSLMRGSQIVVAGDEHQLPPTTFFADGADEEEDGDEELTAAGFESLLKLTGAFLPKKMLQWHYRSRDEALIAFSNHHIYGDRLVTFPGSGGAPPVSHVLVEQAGADGEEESSAAEVRKVVELVLDHATQHPDLSLGVIAMGIKHANRVQAALDQALRERPDLEPFFDPNRDDRFFVKNLERVQGDERDVIMLTVGYGKDRQGRLPYRFGPILYEGGERRLNVAVTRARRRMILISSFSHLDMDPSRSKSKGVELLRNYLQFAASQGRAVGEGAAAGREPGEFEADVLAALTERGLKLLPRWGASSYRIDLVAQHPTDPERFVLAIECDGDGYRSVPTARDR
ncbi:MAG: AAA domain-containing protein, partial [Bacillota bacterium]